MEIHGNLYLFHTNHKPSQSSSTMKAVHICLQSINCIKPTWMVASQHPELNQLIDLSEQVILHVKVASRYPQSTIKNIKCKRDKSLYSYRSMTE